MPATPSITSTPIQLDLAGVAAGVSTVSAELQSTPSPFAAATFAHGAGAGMTHAFMRDVATALAEAGVAVLRFNFPAMEAGRKRVDTPAVAHATIVAAHAELARRLPDVPRFAIGKSFGGRMSTQAAALGLLPDVRAIVLLGFPLHPAAKPGIERAVHLADVRVPMLFVSGTRDTLAETPLLRDTVDALGALAELRLIDGADHGFARMKLDGATPQARWAAFVAPVVQWMAAR